MWKNWIKKSSKCVVDVKHFDWLDVESKNWQTTWIEWSRNETWKRLFKTKLESDLKKFESLSVFAWKWEKNESLMRIWLKLYPKIYFRKLYKDTFSY